MDTGETRSLDSAAQRHLTILTRLLAGGLTPEEGAASLRALGSTHRVGHPAEPHPSRCCLTHRVGHPTEPHPSRCCLTHGVGETTATHPSLRCLTHRVGHPTAPHPSLRCLTHRVGHPTAPHPSCCYLTHRAGHPTAPHPSRCCLTHRAGHPAEPDPWGGSQVTPWHQGALDPRLGLSRGHASPGPSLCRAAAPRR